MASPGEYKLLCMGNPLLDIVINCDEALLKKYDLKANDQILAAEKHKPLYDELVEKYQPMYVAGGATQNAARAAQYLLPPKSTVYIGCVGNDPFAKTLESAAEKAGLRCEYMVVDGVATGTCAVLCTNTDRSLVANLSAAEKYKIDDLKKPEKWKLVENAFFFYIGGFFLTVSPDSILEVAKHAAATNKFFSMNLSAPFIPHAFKDQLDATLPYCDMIFGNESEADAYAKSHGWEENTVADIATRIAKLPKVNTTRDRVVVFTQGTLPTVVAYPDGTIKEYSVIKTDPKEIVDTNGAGDAFVGAFLSQLMLDKSIDESVAAGNWLANIAIKRKGASLPEEKLPYPPGQS